MYRSYAIRAAFGHGLKIPKRIDYTIDKYSRYIKNVSLLGSFVDNHDNTRFLCDYPNDTGLSSLLYVFFVRIQNDGVLFI